MAASSDTIRVGTFLPLSGPMAPRGKPALAGLNAFLQRINAQGGVHGRHLELLSLDDEFDPARTITVAQRLAEEENVFCLVAPLGTPTNKAVLDYLEKSGMPVVASLSGSSLLTTPPRHNYFALQVNYVVEGTLLARYAVEALAAQRIAIFYSNDDFGQEGARAFQVELASHDLAPVHVELGWREGLATGAIIERLKAAGPDTVLLYTYLDQAAALLQEAEHQGFRPQWLGSYALWDPVLFDLAGESAVDNMIVGRPYLDPLGPDAAAVAYRRDLAQYSPQARPGGYSASGYTAAALLVEGLQRVGPNLTRERFITALESLVNWSGGLVTGISYSRFDRRGAKSLRLSQATKGRWVSKRQTLALRDRLLNITAPLALQVNILTRQVLEALGKQRIQQKATDVARQCAIFIQNHPDISLAELQEDEAFQQIARQSIGQTGYTALYGPAPFPAMRIHPNPNLVDVDLRETDRPERFPDWWQLYQYSLANGGQEGGGYYNWEDIDGVMRQKYQYFLPVAGTRYILAATTYLGEFFQPFEEAEQAIRHSVSELTSEIAHQILDPIQHIMDGVARISHGDLDFQVEAGPAEEAQGLAQAFNGMTRSLRELSQRWTELNQELEARVGVRTQELAEANRQLQLSNRSLHEMNRQLREAKTAAEQARKEAEEANRLKSRFLSNISHELRAPLNAIINFSKLLLVGTEGPLTNRQSDFLGRMRDAGEYLLGLLNDMLDLSRIEAGVVDLYSEECNLAEIIRGVMSTAVGLTRDKPIQLHTEIEEHLPLIWADSTRVRQVLLNLLANAAKFTEQGQITVTAGARGDHLLVSVADTGPGVAPADQARIFEAYVKKRDGFPHGAGLGLSISRQLVEMHGGDIWLENRPGQGATFHFTLPMMRQTAAAPVPGSHLPARSPLILVVDNDRATYQRLSQPLRANGYRIAGLTDSSLALNRINHIRPTAVIVDIWQTPGISQLTRLLQQNWPHLPLLPAAFRPEMGWGEVQTTERQLEQGIFVDEVVEWLQTHAH